MLLSQHLQCHYRHTALSLLCSIVFNKTDRQRHNQQVPVEQHVQHQLANILLSKSGMQHL